MGLALALAREVMARRWSYDQWARLLIMISWPVIVLASLIRWTLMTIATQGRLMFPSMAAISILITWGLARLVPKRWHWVPVALAAAVALFAATATPFVTIAPAYTGPAPLTDDLVAGIENLLDADFEGRMRLLGYDLHPAEVAPGESVEVVLYWRGLAVMDEDYSVFVHLLGADDLILSQRDTYPGLGSYPTSLWEPGDTIADRYVLPVPQAVLAPSEATVEVGLCRLWDLSLIHI